MNLERKYPITLEEDQNPLLEDSILKDKLPEPPFPKPNKRAYLDVSFLSSILFMWVTDLAKENLKRPFEQDSHQDLRERDNSDSQYRLLKQNWERYKGSTNRLYKALFRTYRGRMLTGLFLNLIPVASVFMVPIIVSVTINFIGLPEPTYWQKVALLVSIVAIKMLCGLLEEYVLFFYQLLGLNASSGLGVLIFDKCLRFSPLCDKRHSIGSIQNHFEIDRVKISTCLKAVSTLTMLPIELIAAIYVLYYLIGISFLAGFGVMLLAALITMCMGEVYTVYETQFLEKKDQRIKKLNELLGSIRYVKMSGFEEEIAEKVAEVRREEIKLLKKKRIALLFMVFADKYSSYVITLAVFSMFLLLGNDLTPDKIFTTATMLFSISYPIKDASAAITSLLDAHVSIQRLEKFLNAEEIDLSILKFKQKDESSSSNALEISNGTFYWLGQESDLKEKECEDEGIQGKEKPENGETAKDQTDSAQKGQETTKDLKVELPGNEEGEESDETREILGNGIEATVAKFESKAAESKTEIKYALKNINMNISKGKLTAIVGPTGCGKSSLLYALAGEMKFDAQNPPVVKIYGHMSFLPQKPWLINATLKQNILFESPFDKNKYQQVIKMACLDQDIAALNKGDNTEIGERGINLSGGQKARVALARALYTESDIYLFDDTLSALDINVGTYILRECILDYLRDKTRLLVTHNMDYLKCCDHVIVMKEGAVEWQGTYQELLANNSILKLVNDAFSVLESTQGSKHVADESQNEEEEKYERLAHEVSIRKNSEVAIAHHATHNFTGGSISDITLLDSARERISFNNASGLILEEERETGRVKWTIYKLFMKYYGNLAFWVVYFAILIAYEISLNAGYVYLSYWGNNYSPDTKFAHLKIFTFIILGQGLSLLLRMIYTLFRSIQISRRVHNEMLGSVIRAPIPAFFDRVPIGRIVNRFSKDIEDIDSQLTMEFDCFTHHTAIFLADIIICAWGSSPFLILTGLLFFVACFYYHNLYDALYRELERLASIAKSPIVTHFSESIRGLAIIRSLKSEKRCFEKLEYFINEELKNRIVSSGLESWFTQRCALSSTLVMIPVFVALIFFKEELGVTPSIAGLLALYSLTLEFDVRFMLASSVTFQKTLVALERCSSYCNVKPEKTKIRDDSVNKPAGRWLAKGKVKVQDLQIRYREDLPFVLKSVSFEIKPGEKIGVVGRTGSGKSTLISALLRVIEASSGSIFLDDINIASIDLKELRQSITLIPQEATLFDGTMRENIDLLHRHSDQEIWAVLESIGLKKTLEDRNGLDSKVEDSGDNFSAGEKQLISIARGFLTKNKLVLVDEASSNIDMETEKFFLQSIKDKFHDCTVLMIAHRLNTIIDFEKILVLQEGEVVEFGPTQELLRNEQSIFSKMVREAEKTQNEISRL